MKAVGQERRSAAQPPRHPSGQKIGGDGTWGEGRPPFAETGPTSTAPDKRGSPVPAIAIGGASGEAPTATATSLPDKRGGSAPQAMLGGPGTEKSAEGGGPPPDEPRDPCAKMPAIHAEGSQQAKEGASADAPKSAGLEVACHRGKVHSAAAGRSEKRTVPSAAAPDGVFAVLTGEQAKSPPQGPAGGFADAPAKSAGYGTERIDVGSCAPQDPSMTVRMPPSHPAMGAAPRRRPTPSVPAFGARAALTAPRDDDVGTKAPRGLGVSQVHLSGPMLYPGPRLPRTDSLAEAPSGSLADESAPAGQRQAAAPSGTAGAGQAKGAGAEGLVTPTAAQAAASARGGGGGGGLTAAQQHATNAIRMDEVKGEIGKLDSALPGLKKDADEAAKQLAPLQQARDGHYKAQIEVIAAKRSRDEVYEQVGNEIDAGTFITGGESHQLLDAADAVVKAAEENATAKQFTAESKYQEERKDADEKQRKADDNQEQWNDMESERQTLDAKNRKLEDGMSPTDKARAEKDKSRLKRDQDRQAEIEDKLEKARQARATRNSDRPDYRATQRAKARRAGNKSSKGLAKAAKLLRIAQNNNLSATARKSALAKAKKQVQKAKQAAMDKLNALDKAKAGDAETREAIEELEEVEKLEKEIDEAEEDLEEEEQEPPPPDPCLLPCDCNIPCESPDRCVCSRQAQPGGTPVFEGGGGGGADEPAPPDVLEPEGSTVAEEGNGDGEDGEARETKGKGGRGDPFGPAGGDARFPDGVYCCAPQGDGAPALPPPPPDDGEEAKRKLKEEIQTSMVSAAAALDKGRAEFVTTELGDKEAPNARAARNSKHWEKNGKGIETTDPAAGIEEIFTSAAKGQDATMSDVFQFDCASSAWVVRYKAVLDAVGKEKFNELFGNYIVINGSASSGDESAKPFYKDKTATNPSLVSTFSGPPYEPGDVHYVSTKGGTEGGENVIRLTGGNSLQDDLRVWGWGEGKPSSPKGEHTLKEFKDAWGENVSAKGTRLNMDAIYRK